jgi:hypothetical protein
MGVDQGSACRPRSLHPTSTDVAATFLDILFGVLLGLIVFEYPAKEMDGKPFIAAALFNLIYFTLLLKSFLHWLGLRHDTALFDEFLDYRPQLSDYFAGIFTALAYFVCLKWSTAWFQDGPPMVWALRDALLLLGLYRGFDAVANIVSVPSRARQSLQRRTLPLAWAHVIEAWYSYRQPRIIRTYFAGALFLVSAPFIPFGHSDRLFPILLLVTAYVIVELHSETVRFRYRREIWAYLTQSPRWTAPAGWKLQSRPTRPLAVYQIPAAVNAGPGRCDVFVSLPGNKADTTDENFARWVRRCRSAVRAHKTDMLVNDLAVHTVDLTGDFRLPVWAIWPFRTRHQDHRLLGAAVKTSRGLLLFRCFGPEPTISEAFRAFAGLVSSLARAVPSHEGVAL